jgi:soluble lytic murein transglycosylase
MFSPKGLETNSRLSGDHFSVLYHAITLSALAAILIDPNPSWSAIPGALPSLPPALNVTKSEDKMLSQVIQQGLLGIDEEPTRALEELKKNAKTYSLYRKHKLSASEETKLRATCERSSSKNPFCQIISQNLMSLNENQELARIRQKQRQSKPSYAMKQITEWIRGADLEKLKTIPDRTLFKGLKTFTQLSDLNEIIKKTSESSSCPTPRLGLMLAQKTEEFLPDEDARRKAIELYRKTVQCETTPNDITLVSRLRLSLLQIWSNDCKAALPQLEELSLSTTSTLDFRSRALYWKHQCGNQLKNQELTAQSRQGLIDKFPFSLHSLLVQLVNGNQTTSISTRTDSPIQFRTNGYPQASQKLRATEALIKIDEPQYALELLLKIQSQTEKTNPGFRLYLAALYYRLDEALNRFRILTSVFKDDPNLISKASLELFYPQNLNLSKTASKAKIDDLLLLSLIRQESAFNHKARSPAGAMGLMQVMPHTARKFYRLKSSRELYNPDFNLKVGSRYFSHLLKNYGGDAELALAAYNAGPKRVDQWLKRYPIKDRILFLDLIPFRETRDYVSAIARNYFWYVSLYSDTDPNGTERKKNLGSVFTLFKI